jgi:hypothetical protein
MSLTGIIDDIRDQIGRGVTFVTVSGQAACTASGCGLDPITNESVNSFCPTCSGEYWIDMIENITISGHVTWGSRDLMNWVPGGQYFDGDCRVQIKHTDTNITVLDRTKHMIVDGKTMEIQSTIYRGVPQLNRILIDTIEKE